MGDLRELARALQTVPGVRSVSIEGDTVVFFVADEHMAGVLRNLQSRIDGSTDRGEVALSVTSGENRAIGFAVVARNPGSIDVFTRALGGESKPRYRLTSGCPRCGDLGMAYLKRQRQYICRVCGSTIDEDLVEK